MAHLDKRVVQAQFRLPGHHNRRMSMEEWDNPRALASLLNGRKFSLQMPEEPLIDDEEEQDNENEVSAHSRVFRVCAAEQGQHVPVFLVCH